MEILHSLYHTIASRKDADPETSYTAALLASGTPQIARKLGEEAVETAIAAMEGGKKQVIAESADLLYHLLVLWAKLGIKPEDVEKALKSREGVSGIAEKKSRKRKI